MLHVQAACGLSSRRQLSAAKSIRPERTLAIQSQRSSFNGNQGTIFFQFPRSFTAQAVTAKKAASAAVSDAPHAEVLADTVLVVESKTKANKIQNYLGPSYKVPAFSPPAELSTFCSRHLCQTRHVVGLYKSLMSAFRF